MDRRFRKTSMGRTGRSPSTRLHEFADPRPGRRAVLVVFAPADADDALAWFAARHPPAATWLTELANCGLQPAPREPWLRFQYTRKEAVAFAQFRRRMLADEGWTILGDRHDGRDSATGRFKAA